MSYRIVKAQPSHVRGILDIYGPIIRNTATSFETEIPSEDEFLERLVAFSKDHAFLVCLKEDAVAGYAYAGPQRVRAAYQWNTEVSVYVHPDHHRKGIARALYGALLEILTSMGFVNALAGMTMPNPGSEGFHESMGFREVGLYPGIGHKFGRWHDVRWTLLKLLDTENPAPLRKLEDVEWKGILAKYSDRLD